MPVGLVCRLEVYEVVGPLEAGGMPNWMLDNVDNRWR
jgi:hypothetical protein